jgi:hypothetical protein
LKSGHQLAGQEGQLRVVANTRISGVHRVYNMTVEGEHVYYVSNSGALVHNTCGPKRGNGGRGGGPDHAQVQSDITKYAGGKQEQPIPLSNGKTRIADNIDASGRIHQVGEMRSKGGFRPNARERGAIEDIRKALGPNADIIFHDKKGLGPTLINPDKQPNWKAAPKSRRLDP